jgi:hypothetical protein
MERREVIVNMNRWVPHELGQAILWRFESSSLSRKPVRYIDTLYMIHAEL